MRKPNLLKGHMVTYGYKQFDIAMDLRVHTTRVSRWVNLKEDIPAEYKKRFCKLINISQKELDSWTV